MLPESHIQLSVCDPVECRMIETFGTEFKRSSKYLTHENFNTFHSETEMMRFLKNSRTAIWRSTAP
jgi:hypothetical protein